MIAAASWPPRAPPALRTTVFTAVADPVRAAGTAETTWFGKATRHSQNPTPSTEVAARAILFAATHHRREVWVKLPTSRR